LGRVFTIALAVWLFIDRAPASAEDRVATLTKLLASSSDKTRLSAVLALAKLGDPAALKPLTTALHDPSERVRAVAATALGRLEHIAALATLRTLATDDRDPEVRKAASTAVIKLAKASHQRDERARQDALAETRPGDRPDDKPGARSGATPGARSGIVPGATPGARSGSMPGATPGATTDGRLDAEARRASPAGHGLSPVGVDTPHPDLYLLINSSADESPGNTDKRSRELHAQIVKRALAERLKTCGSVTQLAGDARRWNLDARHIDLSVTRLEATVTGGILQIDAQLRVAISDDSGKMLSFLSGGAKVSGRNGKLDTQYLPALRREALENAMRGMFDKLLAHLHDQPPI
jgi:hypothetical protein